MARKCLELATGGHVSIHVVCTKSRNFRCYRADVSRARQGNSTGGSLVDRVQGSQRERERAREREREEWREGESEKEQERARDTETETERVRRRERFVELGPHQSCEWKPSTR